jgi:hypothetical protein
VLARGRATPARRQPPGRWRRLWKRHTNAARRPA